MLELQDAAADAVRPCGSYERKQTNWDMLLVVPAIRCFLDAWIPTGSGPFPRIPATLDRWVHARQERNDLVRRGEQIALP